MILTSNFNSQMSSTLTKQRRRAIDSGSTMSTFKLLENFNIPCDFHESTENSNSCLHDEDSACGVGALALRGATVM